MIATASSITPHALVSGANFSGGGDPSLIPQWNGQVVIFKDLTVLLNLNIVAREEIFSIFRDCYEGRTEKSFGNGVRRVYDSKFGIIAGVTPIIEIFAETHTAMASASFGIPSMSPRRWRERWRSPGGQSGTTSMRTQCARTYGLLLNGSSL